MDLSCFSLFTRSLFLDLLTNKGPWTSKSRECRPTRLTSTPLTPIRAFIDRRATSKSAKARSDEIDRWIEEDARKLKATKALVLGTRESSRTALMKAMKVYRPDGSTRDELMEDRPVVWRCVLESAHAIVLEMRRMGLESALGDKRADIKELLRVEMGSMGRFGWTFDETLADAICQLWNDPVVPGVFKHSSELDIRDDASYFLSQVQRIGSPDYVHTDTDVLHAQGKHNGIVQTRINMDGLSLDIINFGALQGERRKWIHCFENVPTIIFCAALSDYDQLLVPEDPSTNCMLDNLVVFESAVKSRWFQRSDIILLFTGLAECKEKLTQVPLERYFPDYPGGPDADEAARYILGKYKAANSGRPNLFPIRIDTPNICNVHLVLDTVRLLRHTS